MMDVGMAAIFVISVLVLATVGLWQDWRVKTHEFREMRSRLLEMQESRRGGEEE